MLQDFLQQTYFHNRIFDYVICLVMFFAGVMTIRIFERVILSRLKRWSQETETKVDDLVIRIIEKKLMPVFYIGIFYLSIQPCRIGRVLNNALERYKLICNT